MFQNFFFYCKSYFVVWPLGRKCSKVYAQTYRVCRVLFFVALANLLPSKFRPSKPQLVTDLTKHNFSLYVWVRPKNDSHRSWGFVCCRLQWFHLLSPLSMQRRAVSKVQKWVNHEYDFLHSWVRGVFLFCRYALGQAESFLCGYFILLHLSKHIHDL